jgi:hypothetical protein
MIRQVKDDDTEFRALAFGEPVETTHDEDAETPEPPPADVPHVDVD